MKKGRRKEQYRRRLTIVPGVNSFFLVISKLDRRARISIEEKPFHNCDRKTNMSNNLREIHTPEYNLFPSRDEKLFPSRNGYGKVILYSVSLASLLTFLVIRDK